MPLQPKSTGESAQLLTPRADTSHPKLIDDCYRDCKSVACFCVCCFLFWLGFFYHAFHRQFRIYQRKYNGMRSESHPQQSFAITTLVCVAAGWPIYVALHQFGWTPATQTCVAFCIGFTALVAWMRAGTWPAAMTGGWLLASMYLSTVTQPSGRWWTTAMTPLILLLVLTLSATRFRRQKKERSGLAESRHGRSASQVCANLGVASLAAAFLPYSAIHRLALLALSAALVEATADTLSSEIGQALSIPTGSRMQWLTSTRLFTTGQRVPPGTDGGISLSGTLVGCFGGLLVAAACAWALRLALPEFWIVWLVGMAGIFFDSLCGATLERRGLLGNNAVNFCSTLFAALFAAIAGLWLR